MWLCILHDRSACASSHAEYKHQFQSCSRGARLKAAVPIFKASVSGTARIGSDIFATNTFEQTVHDSVSAHSTPKSECVQYLRFPQTYSKTMLKVQMCTRIPVCRYDLRPLLSNVAVFENLRLRREKGHVFCGKIMVGRIYVACHPYVGNIAMFFDADTCAS